MNYNSFFISLALGLMQFSFVSYSSNVSYLRKVDNERNVFAQFSSMETERLIIRRMEKSDGDALFSMMSNPDVVNQTIALEVHSKRNESEALLNRVIQTYNPDSGCDWIIFAIADKTNNKLIGYCGFFAYAKCFARAEIGYALCKEYWGKGIVPEACKALADYGFSKIGLERLEATVYPENIGSIRVLEKLGMKLEGTLRNHVIREGKIRNRLMYSVLKDEWTEFNKK